ncbi:sugar phosphate isomerase/epimerase family protein [Microterricola pindariensis]|uniref:Sugar phosphate isomerase n=1 Tax=Microterricola pindariensis TaxID=478010 RepID=A0ABX5AUL4_9MICO|nr:sugar phosphate isomerase/epimerase [Microterricola pindariensis]PPL16419.1 sugar phosphate isomerase [Microterricola pindariensis]
MRSPELSVQLYTVKDQLEADLDGTLGRLAGMGLRLVEAFDFVRRPAELAEAFATHGLSSPTGHATLLSDEIRLGELVYPVDSHETIFAAAKTLGVETVIDAFIPLERWQTEEGVADIATRLNAAARSAAEHGLRVGYHNHSQEFVASFGGRSAFEHFADQLDDEVVLEVDLFWAATAGQDVPALLSRLGERVVAVHAKDGIPGVNPFIPGAATFDPAALDQRPAGLGEVPILASLAAAPSVRYAVIEFDAYKGDIFEGIETGVKFFAENGIR